MACGMQEFFKPDLTLSLFQAFRNVMELNMKIAKLIRAHKTSSVALKNLQLR